jgi:hypothetical protein
MAGRFRLIQPNSTNIEDLLHSHGGAEPWNLSQRVTVTAVGKTTKLTY